MVSGGGSCAVKSIKIEAIESGTVIDHIPAGRALGILKFLDLGESTTAGVAINVPSKKFGKKDLIFIADKELSPQEVAKISLTAKDATFNIIRKRRVVHKQRISIPEEVSGILKCINPNCVTNHENVQTRFRILQNPFRASCHYCERELFDEEISQAVKTG